MKNRPPKQAVIDAVKGFTRPFTVEDLFERVRALKSGTSRATVYRTINRLEADGDVQQVVLPSGARLLVTPQMGIRTLLYCEDCHGTECQRDNQLAESIYRVVQEAGMEVRHTPICVSISCGHGREIPLRKIS